MKTKGLTYLSFAIFALMLAGCSALASPTSPASTPMPMPSDTPSPGNNPAPTDTPAPGSTGTVDIKIQNFAFDPPNITIKAGTTVQWKNLDGVSHSITSDTGLWDSGGIAQGDSYTRVFDAPGTYPYHCGVHPTMKGTITVTS
jgi:plastocyanin